jgi:hypothetical protein
MGGGEKYLGLGLVGRGGRLYRQFVAFLLGVGVVCVEHGLRRDVKAVGGLCRCRVGLFGRKATVP